MTDLDELIAELRGVVKESTQGTQVLGSPIMRGGILADEAASALSAVCAERDAALARIAEAAKLHRKYTYYEHEDSCPDTSKDHREERHHESDEIGEFYCEDMPTGDVVCDNCRDVNGDRMDWPCPTVAALDGAPEPERLSIPIPNVPFGPEGVAPNIATASYLIEVVKKLDSGYANVGGSNVTATLRKILVDTAEALRSLPVEGESKP